MRLGKTGWFLMRPVRKQFEAGFSEASNQEDPHTAGLVPSKFKERLHTDWQLVHAVLARPHQTGSSVGELHVKPR